MPCIQRTPKEREDNEARIQAALIGLCAGKYLNPAVAAREHGVNPKTLRDRWLGKRRDNKTAHLSQQLLTDVQSEALVSWCIHLSLLAQPLDRVTVGQYVHALCGKYPSASWVDRFLREYRDELALRSTVGIDPKRARAFNRPTVERHFKLLESVIRENEIPAENIDNMDEKGIQLGGGRKHGGRKFICGRTQRTSLKLRDPNLELVTVVECVSADGTAFRPGFILSGTPGNYSNQWFDEPDIGSIALSPNGWTDDELTYLWFIKVFVPQAMAKNKSGKPILLIMDGHGSHCTDKMIEYGYACVPRVHIFLLPPHTTHKLQPLDCGVFGVAQRRWSKLCDRRAMEGNLITRDSVVSEWMRLRPKFMREDIIHSSFKKTGIYPLSPNVFTAEDFAPSQAFSVHGQLPAGYPAAVVGKEEYESDFDEEIEHQEVLENTNATQANLPFASVEVSQSLAANNISIDQLPAPNEVKQEEDITLKDMLPVHHTSLNTKSQLTTEIIRLRGNLESCIAQRELARAHASLMAKQNAELQKKLNTKKRSGRKKLITDARLVTSDDYINVRRKEAEVEEREAKRLEERAKKRRGEEARREKERIEGAHALVWSAGWRNKRKDDLKDLCYALGISIEGTREVMIKRVEAHLADKPLLANDNRFRALFATRAVTDLVSSQVTTT